MFDSLSFKAVGGDIVCAAASVAGERLRLQSVEMNGCRLRRNRASHRVQTGEGVERTWKTADWPQRELAGDKAAGERVKPRMDLESF